MKNKIEYKNTKIILIALSVSLFMMIGNLAIAQTTETFTTDGTWTCPDGVTSISVEAWGAGGGGGGADGVNGATGGGGGGGAYNINSTQAVTAGTTYTITIGAGGNAGTSTPADGENGGNTSFHALVIANGGNGGTTGISGSLSGAGGTGGAAGTYSGGNGASGGGGGGSGAGSTGNGNNASGTTGGAAVANNGGKGGNAISGTADSGENYGGGGGGTTKKNNDGGAGASGYMTITYTCPANNSAAAGIDQTLDACDNSTTLAGNTPTYGIGTWTVQSGTATITSLNSPTTTITGITIGTPVTLRWTFTNENCTSTFDEMTITTSIGAGCWIYCASTGTDNTAGHVSRVQLNTIDRSSGWDGGYYDGTSISTDVIRGTSYDLILTRNNGSTYTLFTAAWIDYNNDGDFLDAGENIMTSASTTTAGDEARTVNITIPGSATLGETKLRVMMKYNAAISGPCENNQYQETEDYTINILGPPTVVTHPTNQSICYNSSADFNVEVTGIGPFTYQWKYNGSNIIDDTPTGAIYTGANTPTLSVSGAISNATYTPYTCYITNAYGNVTSNSADLIISSDVSPDAPTDLTISDDMVCSGTSITLGATITSGTLEWHSSSCSGSAETSPVSPTETTTYFAKAFDSGTGCYSACSNITVNVLDDVVIIEDPESQYGCAGESLTFSVIATGAGLTYQWQEDSGSGFADITDAGVYSGATTIDLLISDVAGLDGNDYQCVVTGTCGSETSAFATLSEISTGLSGTKTIGAAGDYTTLKAAFDDINSFGLSGDLYLKVISDVTEIAEASLSEWVDCAGNSDYTVTIYPTGATRTISGSIATSLVTLNGADNVTIDGRIDMTGTANSLIFSNTNTGGSTLKLVDDACNNAMQYATFQGVYATDITNGVINFASGTTTGNDNNLITYCDIKDGASTPANGIYSVGIETAKNSNNTISHSNIYNYYYSDLNDFSRGIYIDVGNDKWTINNNSLYQTASRTSVRHAGIWINSTNGNNYTVDNNYIGGGDVECGGSAWTMTDVTGRNTLWGIYLSCSNVGVSIIENNTIKNLNISHEPKVDQDDALCGIVTNGRCDIVSNTIGDDSNSSITLYTDDATFYTFHIGIWKIGDGNVIDNKVGSIDFTGTTNDRLSFTGIQIDGNIMNDFIVSGNIIGSKTTSNSIQTTSSTFPYLTFYGIYLGTDDNFKATINDNTIANITSASTNASAYLVGIGNNNSAGEQIISGNEIRDISVAADNTTSASNPCFVGIINTNATSDNLNISFNSVYNITALSTAGVYIYGIKGLNASGTNTISENYIHSFNVPNSTTAAVKGITLNTGDALIANNMVSLGGSITNNTTIYGIESVTAGTGTIYFNSLYIGGTASGGSSNSYAYYRNGTSTTNIRNNIFVNARSGGSGTHYSYYLSSTSNLTSDYNIYSDNTGGVNVYAGALRTSLAGIQTGTGQDATSQVAIPLFTSTTDLHILVGSPAIGVATTGTGITTDFDNQERVVTGPCIGADENITAPYGTDVYGIYSPDGINGTIEDVEVISVGGAPGGIGYNVATPTEAYWPMVNISGYQIITASNLSCTNSEFTFTTEDGTPDWLFGNGSSPNSASTTPALSLYTSTGVKDVIESFKIYSDFNNITLESPEPGVILGAPSGAGCPTTYTYTSSVAGSAGYIYEWNCTPPGGCTADIADPTASSTGITFVNQTAVNQIYLVTLDIETECCGPLRTIERYITIYPGPTMPSITGSPYAICTGGSQEVSVTTPDASYSYEWYDAEIAGTQIGSGTSNTFTDIVTGSNYFYVQSTNNFGCSSQRTEIEVVGTDPSAPSVDNESTCGDNDVTLFVNSPQAGYTYQWYSGSCDGTLLQAGPASSFTYNITSTTTFYVSTIPPGCDTSICATPIISYNVATDPILWEGDDATNPNDWFTTENWENGCLPTCATNVSIPVTANDPDIGFDPTQVAEALNLNLQASTTLSFSDNKAILQICGNFTHTGTLTTSDLGAIEFTGSIAQTYSKSGTGKFNNVKINNTAATPTLTLSSGDMILGTKGSLAFVYGTVVTGTNKLVLENTATSAIGGYDADRYVNGNLRRYISSSIIDYAFPIGVSDRYALADLTNSGLTGLTYLDAKFLTTFGNSGALDPGKALDGAIIYEFVATEGIWQIDADAVPTAGSYTLDLWFNDGGFGTFANLTDNTFAPVKRPSASTSAADWTAIGGTVTHTVVNDGYSKRAGWSTFSQYGIAYDFSPLPVEFLNFDANYNGESVDLDWITATEINNDYFIIEKSMDLREFTNIGNVNTLAPNGNSTYNLYYSFNDKDVSNGTYYYRLKQFDIDGIYNYSNIASVVIGENGVFSIQPNPAREAFTINYYCINDDEPLVKIFDDRGRLVYIDKLYCIQGQNKTVIDISHFAPGMYMVSLITTNSVDNAKLIKQ